MQNKIIVFYDPYHLDYAGAQKSLTMLMNGLEREKIDMILLTTKNSKINSKINEKIKRIFIPNFVTRFYSNRAIKIILEGFFIFNIFLFKIFDNKKYIFIGNEELGVITLLPLKLLFKKVIWYIRSSDNLGVINKLLYNLSNHIMTMDYSLLDNKLPYFNRLRVSSLGTVFIPTKNNTIDNNILEKIKNKKIIANIGAIVPRKNILESIEAFEKIENKVGYNLLVIGPKVDNFSDYYQEVKERSFKNNEIIFIENYSNIEWIYEYIEILLLTSKDEGIPRVILEALYYNKKVISSDVGAIKNVFYKYIDSQQLYIYDLGNISYLNELITKQINKEQIYQSQDIVSMDFSLENHIQKFLNSVGKI